MNKLQSVAAALVCCTCLAAQTSGPETIRVKKESDEQIFTVVEQMPEYPGGSAAMALFVQQNLNYPETALAARISGKCFIKFVVDASGKVRDVSVIRGVPDCHDCDAEALRVVQLMPHWKPATQNGRPVSCFYYLPISFRYTN